MGSFIFTVLSFVSLEKLNKKNIISFERDQSSNLQIREVKFTKSMPSNGDRLKPEDEKYIYRRFSYNTDRSIDLSLNNTIQCDTESTLEKMEPGFIEEIQNNVNSIYLTYFQGQYCLVINQAADKNSFVVEHCNTKVVLHNYGVPINYISIKSCTIYPTSGNEQHSIRAKNPELNKHPFHIDKDESITILIDEVTTQLNQSLCIIQEEIYQMLPNSFDLLRFRMKDNLLQYEKMEFECAFWDIYGNKYDYIFTLQYIEHFLSSSSKILNTVIANNSHKF